ncbi:hypothetical protein E2562_017165 [Oryza meyeriana var. granulata]|uniref:RING-type domain-containing protein n=1 Tax=Oryza meyeriana var. granulata TaxID=110450 RepID=A0A6G1ELX7_9ORYZ|nr:hypothetical protein E2562_017165 [Oryza meyeriana var. granulata]
MEARLHYSARALLFVPPTAAPSTSPAPAAAPGVAGALSAGEAVENGRGGPSAVSFNTNAIVLLALLVCGLVAAIALHVVLQCALRGGDGGKKRTAPLLKTLPRVAYTEGLDLAGSSRSECAICLTEFSPGEQLRVLPRCNHGFHPRCIDRWLAARPTCPTCRQPSFAAEPVTADPAPATTPATVAVVRVIGVTSQDMHEP